MMRLVIKEIPDETGEITKIQIIEQSHTCKQFAHGSNKFKFNGFELVSLGHPEVITDPGEYGLFVRGRNIGLNKKLVNVLSQEWLEKLRECVSEYNRIYSNCTDCTDRHCNKCPRSIKCQK